MQLINLFTLQKHDGPYESWPLFSELFVGGLYTGTSISGYVIDAQYKCSDGYLLITSDDCPYEEFSHFTLLNEHYAVLSQTGLGVMYNSYLIEEHQPISDDALRLRYWENDYYTLRLARGLGGKPKLVVEQVAEAA